METFTRPPRPPLVAAIGVLAIIGALGATVMTLAHLNLGVIGVDRIGPGRTVVPAAIVFGVGAAAYLVVVIAVFARRRWAWMLAVVVNLAAFVTSVSPIRNFASVIAAATSAIALVLLFIPATRRTMRT